MVKTVDEFFTMQEILDFLKAQADGRAQRTMKPVCCTQRESLSSMSWSCCGETKTDPRPAHHCFPVRLSNQYWGDSA